MSACQNCGKKLHIFHWKQHCPHCGINLRFYGFNEQFERDAKMAELSLAGAHVKLRIIKSAFLGGRLAKARLAVTLLPIIALLLPAAKIQVTLPFFTDKLSLGLPGLIGIVNGGALNLISSFATNSLGGEAFASLKTLILAFAVTVVSALLVFLLTALSFISVKKMAAILCTFAGLGAVSSIAAIVLSFSFKKAAQASPNGMLSGAPSFGLFIAVAAFAAVAAVNFLIAKKGLPVTFEEGALERAEIAKKVKRGEINIDDLPQPVVETAETRALDEEIERVRQQFEPKEGATS